MPEEIPYAEYRDELDRSARRQAFLAETSTETAPNPTSSTTATVDLASHRADPADDPAGNFAREVAVGIREAPLQAVFGGWDAMVNAAQMVQGTPFDPMYHVEKGTAALAEADPERFTSIVANPDAEPPRGREAKSVMGSLARSGGQFAAGYVSSTKALAGLGTMVPYLEKIGRPGVLRALAAGAMTDAAVFDPEDPRLSDFLAASGLSTPFTEFLESGPGDSAAMSRLKNAVEGLGFGGAVEAVSALGRLARARRAASKAMTTTKGTAEDIAEKAFRAAQDELDEALDPKALRALGDREGPRVSIGETRAAVAARRAQVVGPEEVLADSIGPEGPQRVYLNLARIDEPDDIRKAISGLAQRDADAINAARGGEKQSFEEMSKLADEMALSVDDIVGRERGPMGAAEAVAARKLLASSGEQVVTLAGKAASAGASDLDLYAFNRAVAVHYALQQEVIAARTETARALASWRIPAGSDATRLSAVQNALESMGGRTSGRDLARRLHVLGGNPAAINAFVRKGFASRFKDAAFEGWVNSLLASPATHITNILSNSLTSVMGPVERGFASAISGEIAAGEAQAMAYGLMKGARDGLRLAGKAFRTGEASDVFSKLEINHGQAISAEAFGIGKSSPASRAFGHAFDAMGVIANSPSRLLMASDEFFKAINYRMELQALAHREAAGAGLTGEAFARRVTDIVADPPQKLKAKALDFSHYQTFTNSLGSKGRAVQRLRAEIPGARYVMPFVRTPANITKYAVERTPLAPVMQSVRDDIAAGGGRAAQAWAKIGLGTSFLLTAADMAANGELVGRGPMEPSLRAARERQGVPQYAVKVGDRWYRYSRVEPLGFLLGMGADLAEIAAAADDEDADSTIAAGLLSFVNNMSSKTWMRGPFEFIAAIDDAKNSTSSSERFVQSLGSTFVPFSSLSRAVTRAGDPILRETQATEGDGLVESLETVLNRPAAEFVGGIINRVRSQTPGLSTDLPPRRDLWGRPIEYSSGLGWAFDFASPVASRTEKPDPVDAIILSNRIELSQPQKTIQGVKLTGGEYSEYVRRAGTMAKEQLDRLVSQRGFAQASDGPDGGKAAIVTDVVTGARRAAAASMIAEFPDLRARVMGMAKRRGQVLAEGGRLTP